MTPTHRQKIAKLLGLFPNSNMTGEKMVQVAEKLLACVKRYSAAT
jgi:hypothetical protein